MSTCPLHEECGFYRMVHPSVVKRIKYASSFPYCNTHQYQSCAIRAHLADGRTPPLNLLPNGHTDSNLDTVGVDKAMKVVVLDDSVVFAMFAANAVATVLPNASVVRCTSYDEAAKELENGCGLVVCGYGVGDGKTAHDVRRASSAPMVLLTGRPETDFDKPSNARVVLKGDGPEALRAAIGAAVSC